MDFQSYNDYMRNTLGFSGMGNQGIGCMNCGNMCTMPFQNTNQMWQSSDIENMYPTSYKIIYPIVVSACNSLTLPITEEMLERVVNDIYDRVVTDERISVDIGTVTSTREEDRQGVSKPTRPAVRRNRFLRDLIRILILREILERRSAFPRF